MNDNTRCCFKKSPTRVDYRWPKLCLWVEQTFTTTAVFVHLNTGELWLKHSSQQTKQKYAPNKLLHPGSGSVGVITAYADTDCVAVFVVCSLVVLFSMCEEVLTVWLCSWDVQGCVHPSAASQRPLQTGAVLLQAAPQLVVQSQQLGVLSFKCLLQEGRG